MRITQRDLEQLVERVNELTESPLEAYHKLNGQFIQNEGHYLLDYAYGGVKLTRLARHGSRDISSGYGTKKELYNFLNGMLTALDGRVH